MIEFHNFISGLLTGLNANPVLKYSAMGLVVMLIVMKVSKWIVEFKRKV